VRGRFGCPRTILADTAPGFGYKTPVPDTDKLAEFTAWRHKNITEDEGLFQASRGLN
jgi:hypothetical protein